ncbi:hypothetical protein NOCARDAX2BIS_50111 [Nocardioides sp. AX2bis]|nr:hypothetical protein NOCARDAX2BIS_50111 [Nocardioides sp. AX2bis]
MAHALPLRRRRVAARLGALQPAPVVARCRTGPGGRVPPGAPDRHRGLVRRAVVPRRRGPPPARTGSPAVEAGDHDLAGLLPAQPGGDAAARRARTRPRPAVARPRDNPGDDPGDDLRRPAVDDEGTGLVARRRAGTLAPLTAKVISTRRERHLGCPRASPRLSASVTSAVRERHLGSGADVEGRGSVRLGLPLVHTLHARRRGPLARPGHHLVDGLGRSLDVQRDRAVGLVAHPADQSELLCPGAGRGAVADALDVAADHEAYGGGAAGRTGRGVAHGDSMSWPAPRGPALSGGRAVVHSGPVSVSR